MTRNPRKIKLEDSRKLRIRVKTRTINVKLGLFPIVVSTAAT